MKVKSVDLNNVLNLVKPVANGRIMPILGNIKIESIDNKLTVIASNSEMQIETSCDSSGIDIVGCIDSDKLDKFVKSSSGDIDITIDGGKALLKGKSRSTVNVLSVDDFPEMKIDLDKSILIKISSSDLALAINSVIHCLPERPDVRTFLNGVSFKLSNGELTIVCSDGFRLSTITLPVNCSESIECIIYKTTAQTLAKAFKNCDIELRLNRNSLSVTDGETTIIGKNIDAKFPDFGKVLNVVRTNNASIERSAFVSAIDSVLLTATDQTKRIEMTIRSNNINLVCSNSQGEKSEVDVECEYVGEEFVFGANADYVIQSAKKVDGLLNLHWLDVSNFIMTGDDEVGPTHLIMTVKI
jgi:DNA polymerase-3 subunit beta